MTAFSYDSLWNKAKAYADRALQSRDDNDGLAHYLWAAVALELLGKAYLAHIHPSLVADPSHFHSLSAACGRPLSPILKSVTARTLYDRVHDMLPAFDERMKREAMLMAERRNGELHSGEAPVHGLNPTVWVPQFWRTASVLLEGQAKTLEDWLGGAEAARVSAILADNAEVLRQAVLARIARRAADYSARYPRGSSERAEAHLAARARPLPSRYHDLADDFEESSCPSCACKAWLFGHVRDEDIVVDEDETGGIEMVRTTYSVEEFRCPECRLELEGTDELAITTQPTEFVHEEIREPDYEPDYGND